MEKHKKLYRFHAVVVHFSGEHGFYEYTLLVNSWNRSQDDLTEAWTIHCECTLALALKRCEEIHLLYVEETSIVRLLLD